MFQLFSNHSSANTIDQAASRMDDNVSDEKVALPAERPATHDEILP